MGAPQHAAEPLAHCCAESAQQIEPDQAAIGIVVIVAGGIGAEQSVRAGFDDGETIVDGDDEQHVVHRHAGWPGTLGQGDVTGLDVAQFGLQIPQTVVSCIALDTDAAAVNQVAGDGVRGGSGVAHGEFYFDRAQDSV
ncbi:hypothetical protein GALL_451500 [mine drainage metagenome]|uniref:Uncharacterized protein n=1 Tax=mine drainage metagenome TaxID=410659 RepID=A0A1J5Q028_9ZZZZ